MYYASVSTSRFASPQGISIISPRVQRIKDISIQKEIIRDVTTSEFALKLEVKSISEVSKIDYEMLLSKLKSHLNALKTRNNAADNALIDRITRTQEDLSHVIKTLYENLNNTTNGTTTAMNTNQFTQWTKGGINQPSSVVSTPTVSTSTATTTGEESKRVQDLKQSLRVIVREDGSVDWDGATAAGREVLYIINKLLIL